MTINRAERKPTNLRIHVAAQQLIDALKTIPSHWALTPLQDKSPKRRGWQTEPSIPRSELTKLLQDEYWTGYGLRTGAVSGGVVAIDVDGLTTEPLLQQLSGGELPETVAWTSGKPGKRQLLYQIPTEVQEQLLDFNRSVLNEWQGYNCESGEILEFRYNRCQSALPPSRHPETGSYKWINSPTEVEVATAPQWLCDLLLQLANREQIAEQERQQNRIESDPTGDAYDIRNFAQYLDGYNPDGRRRGWATCKCPAHNGTSDDSLHIEHGTGAYKCHADCNSKTIYSAALELAIARGHQVPKDGQRQSRGDWLHSIRKQIAKAAKSCYRFDRTGTVKLEPEVQPDPVIEYEKGDRLKVWADAIKQGYKYILEQSGTGTQKSYDSGRVEPEMVGAKQIFYISEQHRNPTVDTLKSSNGWADLETKHNGLTREFRPNGETRLKRTVKGESHTIPPNCSRTGIIGTLRDKNVDGADSAAVICGTCPLREACSNSKGPGWGHLYERRNELPSPKLRLHPDSLPSPYDFDCSEIVSLWDEKGQHRITRSITVSLADLRQTFGEIAMRAPSTFKQLETLFEGLRSLLDGSTKIGLYGLSHAAVMALLPSEVTADIAAVERLLQPDLNFLNTTAQHGVDLADLPSHLRKKFSDRDPEATEKAAESIVKQWLPDLLRSLGNEGWGALNLSHEGLKITLLDTRSADIAKEAKANIFLDATLKREKLALMLGISPEEILVIRQKQSDHHNLDILQVASLGRLGMNRGNDQQQRVDAIIAHYKAQDATTKVIDFKRFTREGEGSWWVDSRGSNDFQQVKTLILGGIPCRNLGELEAEFTVLHGRAPKGGTEAIRRAMRCKNSLPSGVQPYFESEESADPEFREFVRQAILADIKQAIGRLRAHLRPDEQLRVIILGDFALDIPVTLIKASDITPEAATKEERTITAIKRAVATLKEQGKKITQQAIAELVGVTQGYISRFRELLQTLLNPNSKSNNSEAPPPTAEMAVVTDEAIAASSDYKQVLETIDEVFYEWLNPAQWGQFWQQLRADTQIRILEVLSLSLSPSEMRLLLPST
ncbi:bifunctional DNA primase/polymerase [Trichocoleus sp. FACHB-591]|nr:bifunctional DNA primase/polymerase [Trichocoleus sp. FACHB-591]